MVMQRQDKGQEGFNWFYMWSHHLPCTCEVSTAVQAAHSIEKTRKQISEKVKLGMESQLSKADWE